MQHLKLCTLRYHGGASRHYLLPACSTEWAEKTVADDILMGDVDVWAEHGYEIGYWESITPYAWPFKVFEVMVMTVPDKYGPNERVWEVMNFLVESPARKEVDRLVENYVYTVTQQGIEVLDCKEVEHI